MARHFQQLVSTTRVVLFGLTLKRQTRINMSDNNFVTSFVQVTGPFLRPNMFSALRTGWYTPRNLTRVCCAIWFMDSLTEKTGVLNDSDTRSWHGETDTYWESREGPWGTFDKKWEGIHCVRFYIIVVQCHNPFLLSPDILSLPEVLLFLPTQMEVRQPHGYLYDVVNASPFY